MKDATEIVLILDESGSMAPLTTDTIGSVNKFVAEQASNEGEANIEIVTFSTSFKVIRNRTNVKVCEPITTADYNPGGGTALVDTLVNRIDRLGDELAALKEHQRPNKVIFVILTDGQENSSSKPMSEATSRIKKQTEQFKWTFLYLGAGPEAFDQSAKLGIWASHTAQYGHTSGGTMSAFSVASASVTRGRKGLEVAYSAEEQSLLNNSISSN
jgi:Mg-chelatase subunit ChlD